MADKITLEFGSSYKKVEVGEIKYLAQETPMQLDSGEEISNFPIAFQTYGTLNADKSNAILVLHGLTGDQYLAGENPVTGKDGWWCNVVGDGKIIDTNKYFVISPNSLGGCFGSYGAKNIADDGKPFGLRFPIITIGDMVEAQKLLIDSFGIDNLYAIIGGSMGGMQTLSWAAKYPHIAKKFVPISCAASMSAQNIAFNEIARRAIIADENFCGGSYIEQRKYPSKGLSIARMMAHVTYLSDDGLKEKFGRRLQDKQAVTYGFDADFQIESYLRYQGMSFVERFDANSYLYLTRALDYFDLTERGTRNLSDVFSECEAEFCVICFSSDWLFSPEETKRVAQGLSSTKAKVSFVNIETNKGHDSFLLDEPDFLKALAGFID